jgi:hypothetical protein
MYQDEWNNFKEKKCAKIIQIYLSKKSDPDPNLESGPGTLNPDLDPIKREQQFASRKQSKKKTKIFLQTTMNNASNSLQQCFAMHASF